jgi:DNA-directed RNA polymerase III subunit RPC7
MDQPTLKRKDLHAPFFPPEVFEGYFNPKRKLKSNLLFLTYRLSNSTFCTIVEKQSSTAKPRMNLDEMGDEDEDQV